jgi:hypothetical protein
MVADVFGDLGDPEEVLAVIGTLRATGELDAHQTSLARVVRFKEDGRLQETALDCCLEIGRASDVLIAEALNALVSDGTSLPVKLKAARALGYLIPRFQRDSVAQFDVGRVYETMAYMASRPQPPVLGAALYAALEQVRPGLHSASWLGVQGGSEATWTP